MDPQSDDFQFGQITTEIKALHEAIGGLRTDISGLCRDLQEIKLFRAKVLGASMALSGLVALAVEVIAAYLKGR